jgi:large subunit ribosomal protein L18
MGLSKLERRQRIQKRIRKVSFGTPERPRLAVFRSNKEIYAQIIDDRNGVTLVASVEGTKIEQANAVGKSLAEKALAKGISSVAFDRGGNLYHGRVKSLAEGAREGGLKF